MPENKHKRNKKIEDIKKTPYPKNQDQWYLLSVNEVIGNLATSKLGLSQKEVKNRQNKHGSNELPRGRRAPWFVLLIRQFQSSLVYVLLIASIISFFIGEIIDAYVILAAVIVNVVVGFFQEYKAQRALESLQKIVTRYVWVIRDGMERKIESKDLVPGDVVIVSSGDKIAADGRLFDASYLKINEAPLTGESQAVDKDSAPLQGELVTADQTNMVFSGTVVTEGHGRFFVTSTGAGTEIGKIATMVKSAKEVRTPMQEKLDNFSKKLAILILAASFVLAVVGILRGHTVSEMFVTAVAVAVSAIPEGLVIGVTVILAIGMQRILRKRSLVRKLVAAETLGSVNVICADKTGTITLGKMRVARVITENHDVEMLEEKTTPEIAAKKAAEIKKLNKIAVYCNDAVIGSAEEEKTTNQEDLLERVVIGSPTEQALLLSAIGDEFKESNLEDPRPRIDEIPFDSKKKFMAVLSTWTKKQKAVYLKGAPEKILNMCSKYQDGTSTKKMSEKKRSEFIKLHNKLSSKGLRLLAGAYKGVEVEKTSFDELPDYNEEAVFVGFWGIKDPVRPEAQNTIERTKEAGIQTVIITGDNKNTALSIAREVGLKPKNDEIIDGAELASLSDSELAEAAHQVKIFSRATPEDKLRIVRAFQKQKDVVAMTGDGINDAPALSRADIGVALGTGTDVAKEASDMIVLDSNISTIVAAVRQGRVIFDNIKKVILYLLSDSFSEVIIIMIGLLLGWPLVLLPSQILWINLVTAGFPHLALTQEPEEPKIMSDKPVKRDEPILDFERKFLIFFISAITAISTLGLFWFFFKTTGDVEKARTVAFATLGVDSLLYVFSVRSIRHSIFEMNQLRNKWLLAAVVAGFGIQILGVYTPFFQTVLRTVPLTLRDWFFIISVCLWVIALIEIIKYFFIVQRDAKKEI